MIPKLTVVMATYRHTEYLPQAMLSVLGQSEKANLIVVHAKEDEETDELLTQLYVKWNLRGRYQGVSTEQADMWVQRQAGLDLVTTPYVCFFDSDDYMMPQWLSDSVWRAERHEQHEKKVPIIGPSYLMTDEKLKPTQEVILPKFSMDKMLEGCIIPDFSVTKTDALKQCNGFFDPDYPIEKTYNFYALWLRMLRDLDCHVDLRPEIGFLYRQHKRNLHHKVQSKRNSRKNVERQQEIAKHYFQEVR